jgi:hypothetical protein
MHVHSAYDEHSERWRLALIILKAESSEFLIVPVCSQTGIFTLTPVLAHSPYGHFLEAEFCHFDLLEISLLPQHLADSVFLIAPPLSPLFNVI